MVFTPFTWVFALSVVASFAESYGIGANDLANAFGTSVGAKALTYFQAVCIAGVCEFLGAFLLGANNTSTIKGGVANPAAFAAKPEVLMWGMFCVMIVAATWDILSCTLELQVSTTHTTVGAILGMTLVTEGPSAVIWYQKDPSKFPPVKGFVSIVLGWIISPMVAMVFTSFVFFLVRTFVLRTKNAASRALFCLPIAVWATCFAITATVLQTGSSNGSWKISNTNWPWIAVAAASFAAVGSLFFIPLLHRHVDMLDEKRQEAADKVLEEAQKSADQLVIDEEQKEEESAEYDNQPKWTKPVIRRGPSFVQRVASTKAGQTISNSRIAKSLLGSVTYNIHSVLDVNHKDYDPRSQDMWAQAEEFPWKAEAVFRYLQVFTACVMSFAHGANDVANAMGPFSVVFYIWENSAVPSEKVGVQDWVLAYGGLAISIGLATYGWKIMRLLGAKSIKLSNARGFCIELCVSLVVIICARYGIPVSTSHLAVFSTVAVGCFEGRKGVNWRMVIKTFAAMLITIAVAMGLTAGLTSFSGFAPYIGKFISAPPPGLAVPPPPPAFAP